MEGQQQNVSGRFGIDAEAEGVIVVDLDLLRLIDGLSAAFRGSRPRSAKFTTFCVWFW